MFQIERQMEGVVFVYLLHTHSCDFLDSSPYVSFNVQRLSTGPAYVIGMAMQTARLVAVKCLPVLALHLQLFPATCCVTFHTYRQYSIQLEEESS